MRVARTALTSCCAAAAFAGLADVNGGANSAN